MQPMPVMNPEVTARGTKRTYCPSFSAPITICMDRRSASCLQSAYDRCPASSSCVPVVLLACLVIQGTQPDGRGDWTSFRQKLAVPEATGSS